MGRKKQHGHQKRHQYGGEGHQQKGNGKGKGTPQKHGGTGGHHEPRYLTLAEGQQCPETKELLTKRLNRVTVIIYGARLSGAGDFEVQGIQSFQPAQNVQDPLETFGNFSARNLLTDMYEVGFVCTGIKYRSREEDSFGDTEGKNYLYFQRQSDVRTDNTTGKKYFLRPHWTQYQILQADLERLRIFKVQLFLSENARGGIRHTLKIFTGTPRNRSQLEKPIWKSVSRCWIFEPIQKTSQQPTLQPAQVCVA